MKWKIILTILWILFWWFLTEYAFMPTWAFSAQAGIYWNLFFFFAITAVIWFDWNYDTDNFFTFPSKITSGFSGILVIVLIIFGFGSCGACNSGSYQKLIGEIKETDFTANIQPIAANQMLIVDEEIAKRIGEKELGTDPGLGSRCELGEFTLQAVKGQLYWIAPLEHTSFFRWWNFSTEGTPGYIRVSATNQEDYALVRQANEKEINIKYQTGAYFGQDLQRHIYTSGYRSELFSNFEFEVDDEWNPYWTVTLYETTVGLGGDNAIGVLTVDPKTGEIKKYSIDDAPKWIDRIQPSDFVKEQVDDWGEYVHGWPNWSGRDKKRVASESSLVLGSDGRSYYYFGLTSSGNDNSTIGFVMVDSRTKKAHWFKQAGATETAAKGSAEGKVQEKGYSGSEGVTYNISGRPTYEFLLKDKAGLMKLIALVNVHDHTIVGIGENRHDAIQDYKAQLANRGNAVAIATSELEQTVLTSLVKRFGSQIIKGNTYYFLILEQKPSIIFMAGTNISNELVLTREGDRVRVNFIAENANQEISVLSFDNLDIGIKKNPIQIENEATLDSVRSEKIAIQADKVVNTKWDSLSTEEKRKLLKKKQ